jgi:hypothetical protein
VRRHAHRTNPASLRLARIAVELARQADAGPSDVEPISRRARVRGPLELVLGHLVECAAVEEAVDVIRARFHERRRSVGAYD